MAPPQNTKPVFAKRYEKSVPPSSPSFHGSKLRQRCKLRPLRAALFASACASHAQERGVRKQMRISDKTLSEESCSGADKLSFKALLLLPFQYTPRKKCHRGVCRKMAGLVPTGVVERDPGARPPASRYCAIRQHRRTHNRRASHMYMTGRVFREPVDDHATEINGSEDNNRGVLYKHPDELRGALTGWDRLNLHSLH